MESPQTYFTTVAQEIAAARMGFVVGILALLFGSALLWFTERRQAKLWALFGRSAKVAQPNVAADKVNEDNNAHLIHVSGQTATPEVLRDEDFGIVVRDCVKLQRIVEMCQWQQEEQEWVQESVRGDIEKGVRLKYYKIWSSLPVDSSNFKSPMGHQNPPMPFSSQTHLASHVQIGSFQAPPRLISKMSNYKRLTSQELRVQPPASAQSLVPSGKPLEWCDGVLTSAPRGTEPAVGDLRVTFAKLTCGPCSVLAVQNGPLLEPFTQKTHLSGEDRSLGDGYESTIELLERAAESPRADTDLEEGTGGASRRSFCVTCNGGSEAEMEVFELVERHATLQEMLQEIQPKQDPVHIILDILGFGLLFFGLWTVLRLVPALFQVIPLIGAWINLFGNFVVESAALLIAGDLWCFTVALAWLMLRPVKAVLLFTTGTLLVAVPTILANAL